MRYLILFLFFAVLNCGTVIISRQKFGAALPATLIASTLLTYYSQMFFHTFRISRIILYGAAVLSLIALIFKRKDPELKHRLFSTGFFCYLLLCVLILSMDYHRLFYHWDEFMHWGKMVKEMIRLDRFYSVAESNLMYHKDYPPFAPLFETIACNILGKHSDMEISVGLHFLEFSLIGPWLTEKFDSAGQKWHIRFFTAFLIFSSVILIMLSVDGEQMINTILIDMLMPIMFIYAFSLIHDEEKRNSFFGFTALMLTMISLILLKQMSIFFAGMALMYYVIVVIVNYRSGKKDSLKKDAAKIAAILFAVLLNYLLWNRYIQALGVYEQFNLRRIKIQDLTAILSGGGSEIQQSTALRVLSALVSKNLIRGPFQLSYLSFAVFAFGLSLLIYIQAKGKVSKRSFVLSTLLFGLGYAGYAVILFVLYLFCFSEEEMLVLTSYVRYMTSLTLCVLMFLFYIVCGLLSEAWNKKLNLKFMTVILCLSVLFFNPGSFSRLFPQDTMKAEISKFRSEARNIEKRTEEGSDILILSRVNSYITYRLNYYMDTLHADDRLMWTNLEYYSDETAEVWESALQIIGENDYVYVFETTEGLNSVLGKFTQEGMVPDYALYRVVKKDGEWELEKI